ncbi:maleylpyruvate isomerase N-terminal domain-containing protein [Mumia sp. DW29H23]|uniref:maleylpyruvate isomerase N-terminal domain-containing protein n=1 Tax=Mumia sp. DW29H23 TaxID=3421241 RepID=UPI003D68C309
MESRDDAFVTAAHISLGLVTRQEVADRWDEPSALPEMTVGMLACHLGRQTVRAHELIPVAATGTPLASAIEHYRRAAWVTTDDLTDPVNDRTNDAEEAALGFEALRATCTEALSAVQADLASGEVADVVAIPWQGWSLRRPDFLLTRLVEIVVHCDDLARSVDVGTPEFPDEVYLPVLQLLAQLATERHGQAAMTSALSRRERMPETISAF